jgi:hypothetical protein
MISAWGSAVPLLAGLLQRGSTLESTLLFRETPVDEVGVITVT